MRISWFPAWLTCRIMFLQQTRLAFLLSVVTHVTIPRLIWLFA